MKPGDIVTPSDDQDNLWAKPWKNPKAENGLDMDPEDYKVCRIVRGDMCLVLAVIGSECLLLCNMKFGWTMVEGFQLCS